MQTVRAYFVTKVRAKVGAEGSAAAAAIYQYHGSMMMRKVNYFPAEFTQCALLHAFLPYLQQSYSRLQCAFDPAQRALRSYFHGIGYCINRRQSKGAQYRRVCRKHRFNFDVVCKLP